jgi:hypothetical protein
MAPQGTGSASRFRIEPDPPIEGGALQVTYIGPASEVEYQVDGSTPVQATPDANGEFRIDSVPVGAEIGFTDNRGMPGFLHREIVALDGKGKS